MVDGGKHPNGGGATATAAASDFKRSSFCLLGGRRAKLFAYGFLLSFVACTAYLAFCPSGAGSPWFNDVFETATASGASYRSRFSGLVSSFFPNSELGAGGGLVLGGNQTSAAGGGFPPPKGGVLGKDESGFGSLQNSTGGSKKNQTVQSPPNTGGLKKNQTGSAVPTSQIGGEAKNQTRSGPHGALAKNETMSGVGSPPQKVIPSKTKSNVNSTVESSHNGISSKNQKSSPSRQSSTSKDNPTSSPVQSSKDEVNKQGKPGNGSPPPPKGVLAKAKEGLGSGHKKNGVPSMNKTVAGVGPHQTNSSSKVLGNGVSSSAKGSAPQVSEAKNGAPVENRSEEPAGPTKNNVPPPPNKIAPVASSHRIGNGTKGVSVSQGNSASSLSFSLAKGNASLPSPSSEGQHPSNVIQNIRNWSVESMKICDIFHGSWVKDDSYPLYPQGSCPHIDEPFNCYLNGRPDRSYQNLRWQPNKCNIPRLNPSDMLERLRGKRLVFVGDSLNRNMWESLVCILRNSVLEKSKVFEASGRHEFRTEGSYSFVFKDYNCSIEFFRSPFLVQEWEMTGTTGKKETLRLDIIEKSSFKYKDANIIVFNTGHWWTHDKTSKGKDYYQEGNRVYGELNVVDAFHKALNTWAKWVDANVNPRKTLVFFRGYSASHFRGGQWNSGGQCDKETEPIKNEKFLSSYPPKMSVLELVLKGMKTPVSYLNITRMTDYRKDAHPSVYRKPNLSEAERRAPERYQDCSHWCLPGVPDSWNELLYAQLLIKQKQLQ